MSDFVLYNCNTTNTSFCHINVVDSYLFLWQCNVILAGGLVFPGSFMHTKDAEGNAVIPGKPRDLFTEANFRKFERSWDDGRVATAFFRGESPLSSDTAVMLETVLMSLL